MYQIPKETKEITKEFHHTNLVWLLEKYIREQRGNWNDYIAEYCEVHQNGYIIKSIKYLADISLQIKKENEPLVREEEQKINNFKHLIKTAWSLGYVLDFNDLNNYLKKGKVEIKI